MLKQKIQEKAAHYFPRIRSIRHHLHRHPELSFREEQTGQYLAGLLQEMGVPFLHGYVKNGIVALLEGRNAGKKTVALRADMDALPIREANAVSYRSENEGVMHACGHDVHMASLLGTIMILNDLRDEFEGTVKLLFQPAEEKTPGGASIMIREGALDNPKPESIFAQHVHPPLETGKVGFREGLYMASCDELYVTVRGKGGHGALPQDGIDPVLISAHIITALQQIVSRRADPTLPSVLSFGKINSMGGATNVIPDEVKIEGTFRTMNETWRATAHDLMKNMAENIAAAMGGQCEFTIDKGYPFLHNHEELTRRSRNFAVEYLGADNVVELPIRMTAEDFSYYSQVMPACFYRLGTGNKAKGITSPIHTNTFDIDEQALELGAGLMAWLAVRELGN